MKQLGIHWASPPHHREVAQVLFLFWDPLRRQRGDPGRATGAHRSLPHRTGRSSRTYDPGMDTTDVRYLRRCVDLAARALEAGDEPFGSVLVDGEGRVCFEDHNRVASGDRTRHPELALARWAAANMTPAERAASTVYTSGEHCPMCAAAHGWVGLGRIVYASSSAQLSAWLGELGVPPPPVATLPIAQVIPGATVEGPAEELAEAVRELHVRFHKGEPGPL